MPVRKLKAADEVEWDIYDVTLQTEPRRPSQHQIADNVSGRFQLPSPWLCFESATERRRLSPIPEGWEHASDEALETLLSLAVKAPKI